MCYETKRLRTTSKQGETRLIITATVNVEIINILGLDFTNVEKPTNFENNLINNRQEMGWFCYDIWSYIVFTCSPLPHLRMKGTPAKYEIYNYNDVNHIYGDIISFMICENKQLTVLNEEKYS